MRTHIKTIHEEEYSDKSRVLGVLLNFSTDVGKEGWKDSFLYVYKKGQVNDDGMYIFFDTIIDLIDYLLYGEVRMKRAYMEEKVFDSYYDAKFIDGEFRLKLEWS